MLLSPKLGRVQTFRKNSRFHMIEVSSKFSFLNCKDFEKVSQIFFQTIVVTCGQQNINGLKKFAYLIGFVDVVKLLANKMSKII